MAKGEEVEQDQFNIEQFLAGIQKDTIVEKKDYSDRITKVFMNYVDNQGTVVMVPFMSKTYKNFYHILGGERGKKVIEWNGHTTKLGEKNTAWYSFLPKDAYGDLTKEESDLYDEIAGLFKSISDKDEASWRKLRFRTYTFFYGFIISHRNNSNLDLMDNVDKPCLLIFPSKSPVDALNTAISQKTQVMKGSHTWLGAIFDPSSTNRKGVVSITFKKSEGPGYAANIAFEINSDFTLAVDSDKVFKEDQVALFNDPVYDFLGWQAGSDGKKFNSDVLTELRDDLRLTLKEINAGTYTEDESQSFAKPAPVEVGENKNGSVDPMKNTPSDVSETSKGKDGDVPF
jgi:hypothetical protein